LVAPILIADLFCIGIIKRVLGHVIKLSLDRSGAVRAVEHGSVLHPIDCPRSALGTC